MRNVKYRWLLIVAVIAAVAAIALISIRKPRSLLLDKAMELENGQFLCEDGTVWEARSPEENDSKTAVKFVRETDPKTIEHEPEITRSEEMGAIEYAQAVSAYGSVYADSSGGVWKTLGEYRHPDGRGDMYLQPYYSLSEPEVDFAAQSGFEMVEDSLHFEVSVLRGED